jgi:TPP-dependent pyruvate/acetoin dehydrogenase alpha subunit
MVLTRLVELRALGLRRTVGRELSPGVIRREAIGVGAGFALGPEDRLCAPGRYLGAHLARGLEASSYLSAYAAAGGVNRPEPLEPSEAVGALSTGVDLWVLAAGMAIGCREAEPQSVAMTIAEESAVAAPGWDELVETARMRSLPLVIVLERMWSSSGSTARASDNLPSVGTEPPLSAEVVDGADVEAVTRAARRATERARDEKAPALVWCVPAVDEAETDQAGRQSDPADRYARRLISSGFPRAEIDAIVEKARGEVVTWTS